MLNISDENWVKERFYRSGLLYPSEESIESFVERVAIIWADSGNEIKARELAFQQVFK